MRYLILIVFFNLISCQTKTTNDIIIEQESDYFEAIEANDVKLDEPKEGEWLFGRNEKGQTFEQYTKTNPVRPITGKSTIYLKPIGQFTNLQKQALKLLRDYVELYFQQKTILLEPLSDKNIPKSARRKRSDGSEQLLASYVLDSLLKGKNPKDAMALMAISEKDLFPKPEWNYVFGLASYTHRVGVSSMYRFQNKTLDSTNFRLCLRRLMSVSTHEIGHMFSFHHCINAHCTMNGSNNLSETDLCPNRLCSECQKKQFWNFRYDNRKRLKELLAFLKENKIEEGFKRLNHDSEMLK
jgi:archaemetzincin